MFRTGLKYIFNFKKRFYSNEKFFLNLVQIETLFWTLSKLRKFGRVQNCLRPICRRTRHYLDRCLICLNLNLPRNQSLKVKFMLTLPISEHTKKDMSSCYHMDLISFSHCAFSSNLFHGHLAQIYIDQLSDPENKKM